MLTEGKERTWEFHYRYNNVVGVKRHSFYHVLHFVLKPEEDVRDIGER